MKDALAIHKLFRETFLSPKGSWNSACPHRSRAGMTVVPCAPCLPCVQAGNAIQVTSKSQDETFWFLSYKGEQAVLCVTCWKYGHVGQNHECYGARHGPNPDRIGDYKHSLLNLLGIPSCKPCGGKGNVFPDRSACSACGGLGEARAVYS